jgi:hypothetical protein
MQRIPFQAASVLIDAELFALGRSKGDVSTKPANVRFALWSRHLGCSNLVRLGGIAAAVRPDVLGQKFLVFALILPARLLSYPFNFNLPKKSRFPSGAPLWRRMS